MVSMIFCTTVSEVMFFRLGLVGNGHAMAQHVEREALHILRRDVAAALQERGGLRRDA